MIGDEYQNQERGWIVETTIKVDEKLLDDARTITGIDDVDEIVEAALKEFIRRQAARNLADLGGTMPDFALPRRRRLDDE